MSKADYKFSDSSDGIDLLHTPEGVRDIYGKEYSNKQNIQRLFGEKLHSFGYQPIQTPTFEFFDIFSEKRGTVAAKNMYRFFDREGNMLALRPDITPSIARCVSKYYKDEELPIRFCYSGNTFINNTSYQGKLKEITQIGAELINDDTSDADAEMLAVTIECLLECGIRELQIEVGHADFFNGIAEEGNFTDSEKAELRKLIICKNMFGVEQMIEEKNITGDLLIKLLEAISFNKGDVTEWFSSKGVKRKRSEKEKCDTMKIMYENFVQSRSLDALYLIINYVHTNLKWRYKRPTLLNAIKKVLQDYRESSCLERMKTYKNKIRIIGRKVNGKCIGNTWLTKGLEFDDVIILDAHKYKDCNNFYVAISRACKNLHIFSETSTLKF